MTKDELEVQLRDVRHELSSVVFALKTALEASRSDATDKVRFEGLIEMAVDRVDKIIGQIDKRVSPKDQK